MSEKYDVIQERLVTVEKTQTSPLVSTKTAENPIYFNHYGATVNLGSKSDPQEQTYILYSYNGSSSDEGSYDRESGTFVTKQGLYKLSNTVNNLIDLRGCLLFFGLPYCR